MVLLCINMLWQYFSVAVNVFRNIHQVRYYHFFIVEIVVESVNLTQMSKQKIIITMMENNYFSLKKFTLFWKKVHIKTQKKKKDVLAIFILLLNNPLYYCKKRRTPIYLIKTVLKRNLKRTLFHNSTWRKLTWMNRNWTGKLQVTIFSTYIFRKKLCSQTLKASSEEVSRCILRKWRQNAWRRMCENFFR